MHSDSENVQMSAAGMKAAIRKFCEDHGWILTDETKAYGWKSPEGQTGYHWTAALEDALYRAKTGKAK